MMLRYYTRVWSCTSTTYCVFLPFLLNLLLYVTIVISLLFVLLPRTMSFSSNYTKHNIRTGLF